MKTFIYIPTLLLFFLLPYTGYAQEDEYDYQREYIFGVNFNTNAGIIGGLMFKHARSISQNQYQSFGIEVVNVKHPKELRRFSPITGNSFIPGKAVYLFAVRPQYGREYILFRKAPEDGVQLNAILAGGPSFGVTKPYYILYSDARDPNRAVSVPYDPNRHPSIEQIYGTGNILEGFDQLKVTLGAHVKGGLSFEFGRINNSVMGVETGLMLEAYTRKINIIPTAQNKSVYSSAFFTLYYGNKY